MGVLVAAGTGSTYRLVCQFHQGLVVDGGNLPLRPVMPGLGGGSGPLDDLLGIL